MVKATNGGKLVSVEIGISTPSGGLKQETRIFYKEYKRNPENQE